MTIEDIYKFFVEKIQAIYEKREAANIADWVFESEGIKRLDRITNKQKPINELANKQINNKLQQLLQHKPVQYVLQEAWFYKMKLFVNEHVLIPRPETEELVEWVVEDVRNSINSSFITHNSELTIFDIGTGSGCIAIALKKEIPGAEVYAIDTSEQALAVAKQNSKDQHAAINLMQLNFLSEESLQSLKSFDIIVSNPPYISAKEKTMLNKNVVDHEPHIALFVEDTDAFIFYKKIAEFADVHLENEGRIYVEVHEDYAKNIQQVFEEKQFKAEIKKDIYGRERMVKAYK